MDRPLAGWLDRMYEVQFQQLELHRSFVEEHLEAARNQALEDYRRTYDGLDADQKEEYAEFMVDDLEMLCESFPAFQWHAQFLVVFATFEESLNGLCRVVQRRLKSDLSLKDMYGQGCERAKVYLSKVGGAKDVFSNPLWQRAVLLGRIRNAIAHAQGHVDGPKNEALRAEMTALNGLALKQVGPDDSTEYRIILSSVFVKEAISALQHMVHAVAGFERDWPDSTD